MVRKTAKDAFTLIELVFAIIIIAISIISLPMINQTLFKGIKNNILQETIFISSAELNGVTSAHWDENSIDANGFLSKVININAECNTTTKRRVGHINQPLHRRCLNNNMAAPTNTKDGDMDDLDDYAHESQTIFLNYTASSSGYKDNYKSSVTVVSNAFFGGSINPNMKKITVRVLDSSGNLVTKLSAYSANIGEVDYYKRSYN